MSLTCKNPREKLDIAKTCPAHFASKPGGDTTVPPSEGLENAGNVATGIALGFNGAVVKDIRNIYTGSILQEWSNGDCGLGRQLL